MRSIIIFDTFFFALRSYKLGRKTHQMVLALLSFSVNNNLCIIIVHVM